MALSFFSLISKLVKKHSPMPFSWWKSAIPWPLNGSAGYSISLLKRWLGQDMDSCPKLIISLISKLVKKHSPMPFSMQVKKCDSVAPERFSRVFHISSKEIARPRYGHFCPKPKPQWQCATHCRGFHPQHAPPSQSRDQAIEGPRPQIDLAPAGTAICWSCEP